MPRTCTVCSHPERREIDRTLVSRSASYRDIAGQYSVSKTAVSRHTKEHLPDLLAKAYAAEEVTRADELLMDVRRLQARTLRALLWAEGAADWTTMLRAVREARENVRLLGELRGKLDTRPVVNVLVSPEWLELRALIVGALEPHPDAREAVVHAIASREGDGGS
jgi:DNA-binding transcriptional ArsR family regulator